MRNLTEPWRDVPGAPTVLKNKVTNAITGQPISAPGPISPREQSMGMGKWPAAQGWLDKARRGTRGRTALVGGAGIASPNPPVRKPLGFVGAMVEN